MEEKISVKSEKVKKAFWLSVGEITDVLSRKKTNTDITKTAIVMISNVAKIMGAEVHDRALDLVEQRIVSLKEGNKILSA
jgi:hypothetical protein